MEIPYRLASWPAVPCAADSASARSLDPAPKSIVMMLTTDTFTPLALASCSSAYSEPVPVGSPCGATARVKSTCTAGSSACSAASAWSRRAVAAVSDSTPPSMSKSSRVTP